MTVDPLTLAHVLDELRRHYLEAAPTLAGLMERAADAGRRPRPETVRLAEWVAAHVTAAMGREFTPAWRRRLLAAWRETGGAGALLAEDAGALGEGEADESSRRLDRAVRRVAAALEGQRPPDPDAFGLALAAAEGATAEPRRRRWRAACRAAVEELGLDRLPALAARLIEARSSAELFDVAARSFPGLSLAARSRLLHDLGFPVFHLDAPRLRALERLGWIRAAGPGDEEADGSVVAAKPTRRGPGAGRRQAPSRGRLEREALRLAQRVAATTPHGPAEFSLLLGLLAGSLEEARAAGAAAHCAARPRCDACPAARWCLFARLRREAPGAEGAGAPARAELLIRRRDADLARRATDQGVAALDDVELLALILRRRLAGASATRAAADLLDHFGSLARLAAAPEAEVSEQVRGIGPVVAAELKAAFELGRRLASLPLERGLVVRTARDVFRALHLRYRDVAQEVFQVLALNTRNELIEHRELTRGTLNAAPVHPREAYRHALARAASAVIFVHNHPSGDPTPSDADNEATRRLREAGHLLGIRMLDHIILGRDAYYSYEASDLVAVPPGGDDGDGADDALGEAPPAGS